MKQGKRTLSAQTKVDKTQTYEPAAALSLVKETATAKFDETVELHLRTGLDDAQRGTTGGRDVDRRAVVDLLVQPDDRHGDQVSRGHDVRWRVDANTTDALRLRRLRDPGNHVGVVQW